MKYRTLWMPQAESFITSLAPEPRSAIRRSIKQLAEGKPTALDLRALEGPLQGYMRLRVHTYRVIYTVTAEAKGPTLTLVAAGARSTVYEAFEKILVEQSPG
jgi:mRNA-degrading endonuclease RelE of RelBE toxin-antitoxin system